MGFFARARRFFAGTKSPGGTGVISTWSVVGGARWGTRQIFDMFRVAPWLFAPASRLAEERATACRWLLFDGPRDDPDRVVIAPRDPRYDVIRLLNSSVTLANGVVLSARDRNRMIALWKGLAGEAFLVKQRNALRGVVGLVPVSPLWVTRFPTRATPSYQLQFDQDSAPQEIPSGDVIALVDRDPANPYGRGVGIGYTIVDEIETDESAAALDKAQLQNMGVPAGLVLVRGASADQMKQVKANWGSNFSGPQNAGKIDFVGAEDMKLLSFGDGLAFKDATEKRRFLRDTLIQLHGMSPEIFGVLDGSTRDSAYVAYYHLALGSLVPWLAQCVDAYQSQLVDEMQPGVWLDAVSPVPEDRELRLRCIATAPGAFRGKDLRDLGGFPPDAELGAQQLSSSPLVATPTQLPSTPAERRKNAAVRASGGELEVVR